MAALICTWTLNIQDGCSICLQHRTLLVNGLARNVQLDSTAMPLLAQLSSMDPTSVQKVISVPMELNMQNNTAARWAPSTTEQVSLDTQFTLLFHCTMASWNFPSILLPGLTAEDECTPCVGGMACDVQALVAPERPCSAGYFCRISANMTTPDIGHLANECPAGSYCPEGTDEPIECPEGTYNPSIGRMSLAECLNCTGGYYCNETGS